MILSSKTLFKSLKLIQTKSFSLIDYHLDTVCIRFIHWEHIILKMLLSFAYSFTYSFTRTSASQACRHRTLVLSQKKSCLASKRPFLRRYSLKNSEKQLRKTPQLGKPGRRSSTHSPVGAWVDPDYPCYAVSHTYGVYLIGKPIN